MSDLFITPDGKLCLAITANQTYQVNGLTEIGCNQSGIDYLVKPL